MPGIEIESGMASETGLRARNEDYGAIAVPRLERLAGRGIVAVVADGIGGAPGGREAAEIAVGKFIEMYYAAPDSMTPEKAAREALNAANETVFDAGRANPDLFGMGTTLSALVLCGGKARTVHVGDTRIYRLRRGKLSHLTEDHNLHAHGLSHILTRSVGTYEQAEPDCVAYNLALRDRFLLCTDGISGVLADKEIAAVLVGEPVPARAAEKIAAAALEAGSADNVTALVIDVTACPAPKRWYAKLSKPRR